MHIFPNAVIVCILGFLSDVTLRNRKIGWRVTEVMTQQLRVLAALVEVLGSSPNTHSVSHTSYHFTSRESDALFRHSQVPCAHIVHLSPCKQNTHTHRIKINLLKKNPKMPLEVFQTKEHHPTLKAWIILPPRTFHRCVQTRTNNLINVHEPFLCPCRDFGRFGR